MIKTLAPNLPAYTPSSSQASTCAALWAVTGAARDSTAIAIIAALLLVVIIPLWIKLGPDRQDVRPAKRGAGRGRPMGQ